MGVITKIFFRGEILNKPRYQYLFLDMEENIHIHYRDLRIELSRNEFEDIVLTFLTQAQELCTIMAEKNYQDGKLPNANQEDIRIWTESLLKHEVKYHPQRVSLEECSDGYHFHYRNYKLLLDKNEFKAIARLFQQLDVDAPYASTYDEVLALLTANDLDFVLDVGNVPGKVLAIAIADYHVYKAMEILKVIGFSSATEGMVLCYTGQQLQVRVKSTQQFTAQQYRQIRAFNQTGRLVDYLSYCGVGIAADELNHIKCQVLNTYYALQKNPGLSVEINPQLWLYAPQNQQVIFPYCPQAPAADNVAETFFTAWTQLLQRLQLGFIKPTKVILAADIQAALQQHIEQLLHSEVAAYGAVDKIYVMGSALRGELGCYRAPFVTGKAAKLGSDIDLLITLNPAFEHDIPLHWRFVQAEAPNHCAIYHVAEIPVLQAGDNWVQRYPHIPFSHHVLDAYVFLPSRGYGEEKDAFLAQFNAKLAYERTRDGSCYHNPEDAAVAAQIQAAYGFQQLALEKTTLSSENVIYKVFVGQRDYLLKLFKVSGNFATHKITEHTAYEAELVALLRSHGVAIPGVIRGKYSLVTTIADTPALLFERLSGKALHKPEYPLEQVAQALAAMHDVQIQQPFVLLQEFAFADTCKIWLPAFLSYAAKSDYSAELKQSFARLRPLAEHFVVDENLHALLTRSVSLHNHGDIAPKNVLLDAQGRACWFDFNNACYGPRMFDILDGAFEFALAENYVDLIDFNRFSRWLSAYRAQCPLTPTETADLSTWIALIGVIKFIKEIRVLLQYPAEAYRQQRALAIAQFVFNAAP